MIEVVVDRARLQGLVDTYVEGLANRVAERARQEAPGSIAQAILVEKRASEYDIVAARPYAIFVHEGTAPHLIVPVNAKVLRFEAGGGVVFAARVQHPGTAANPFLTRALEAEIPN